MRAFALIVLAVGFLAGPTALSQEPQADKDSIQGTWTIVSFEAAGAKALLPPEALKAARVVITADKLTFYFTAAGKGPESRYTIDPSKKPKAIDLVDLKSKGAKPSPGIYLLDGDDLKLCWDANRKSRPPEFTTVGKEGQDLRLLVLKREKKK